MWIFGGKTIVMELPRVSKRGCISRRPLPGPLKGLYTCLGDVIRAYFVQNVTFGFVDAWPFFTGNSLLYDLFKSISTWC